MKKILYDVHYTPCPFRMRDGDGDIIDVGSPFCWTCKYWKSQDSFSQVVTCKKRVMPLSEIPSYVAGRMLEIFEK